MTSDGHERGEVITFYSYKGGVGRTMALVNVAWILAANGLRVLVVDWDLEAPGVHRYLRPLLIDTDLRSTDGLVELCQGYMREVLRPPDEDEPSADDWLRNCARPTPYVIGTDLKLAGGGRLDLMPAGRQESRYSAAVTSFNWHRFYEVLGGGTFLEILREELTAAYDYVLIDSRTGIGDTASICTILMPDVLVACFSLSLQNIHGTAGVTSAVTRVAGRGIRVLPVPMQIEDSQQERLETARDLVRETFAPCLSWLDGEIHDQYWGEIEIPYKPFYAYQEVPSTVADRPNAEGTLLAAYKRLTGWMTEGRVQLMPPLPDAERNRLMKAYLRTH